MNRTNLRYGLKNGVIKTVKKRVNILTNNSIVRNYQVKNRLGFKSVSVREGGEMTDRADIPCFVRRVAC